MSTRRKLQSSPTSGETSRRAGASGDRIAMAEAHFRERLAESERNKEIYLRFAVSINERLNSGIDQIMAAREIEGNSPTRPRMASGSRAAGCAAAEATR